MQQHFECGCEWGKIAFVKAKGEDIEVIKTHLGEGLDENYSCVDGEEAIFLEISGRKNWQGTRS